MRSNINFSFEYFRKNDGGHSKAMLSWSRTYARIKTTPTLDSQQLKSRVSNNIVQHWEDKMRLALKNSGNFCLQLFLV